MPTSQIESEGQGGFQSYVVGFILSLVLTFFAYNAVVSHWFTGTALIVFIVLLALVQLGVQLVFFLHLNRESNPRWNLLAFSFAVVVVLILVLGSLWIMNHLDASMNAQQMNKYMNTQDGL
jgi:cytochrome o ubiquinol oxidase operon protein cyoD